MREAIIAASSRTALAKSFRGSFNMTRPEDLAAHCVRDVLRKVPAVRDEVEDVILGCAQPHGMQGMNIARRVALLAGLPVEVAGTTVNRFCASGLEAIAMAADRVMHGEADAVVAGGVESISCVPRDVNPHPYLQNRFPGLYMEMGATAEVVAKRYGISRGAQDEYALASQQRTARAQADGFFAAEIAPMTVTAAIVDKAGQQVGTREVCCDRDECNRPDTTLEALLALKPHFDTESGAGTVTAGNSSQLSDGASATLVMCRERADELRVPYRLIFRGYAVAGCAPEEMGIGPVFAVPKLLTRHGLAVGDIGLWELNEAFAVQVVYCRERLGIPMEKLNVNGGSISIGHPFGMTGSRLTGTLANEMARRSDARYGVVTMCVGGGQGAAALFEAVLS
jgi:acetyl-CoA acyltransferase